MRLLVCGGRSFHKGAFLRYALDEIHRVTPVTLLIEGGALGADRSARAWAQERGIDVKTFAADWNLGPSAGPRRNQRMIDEGKPDLVVAFKGGKGTADCMRRARAAGIPVQPKGWEE